MDGMLFNSGLYVLDTYRKIMCNGTAVPYVAAQITSTIITIIQIATPVIIILLGMIDLLKGVTSQKEEEIKKGQQTFVKRLIVGISVFLVFVLVKFIIGVVVPDEPGMWDCVNCFVNNNCFDIPN